VARNVGYSVLIIFNELTHQLPMRCVVELLLLNADFFKTRRYTVKSRVPYGAFTAFYVWLYMDREPPVPKECVAHCQELAREFGISALEDDYRESIDPALDVCLLDAFEHRAKRLLEPLDRRIAQLEGPESKYPDFVYGWSQDPASD
jgi:hypothetical protein